MFGHINHSRVMLLSSMCALIFASGCASQVRVTMTEAELRKQVQKDYPKEYPFELGSRKFKVVMDAPEVNLIPKKDRLRLKIPLTGVAASFLPKVSGSMTLNGKLSYNAENYTFYLGDIEVEKLEVPFSEFLPSGTETIEKELTEQAKKHLIAIPLKTLDSDEIKDKAGRYVLKSAKVRGDTVELVLGLPD